MAMKTTTKRQRYIICCGEHGRAVIICDMDREPVPGKPVRMLDARMVLYWSAECGGLLGLAARGPRTTTRITAPTPVSVEHVWQEFVVVSASAAEEIDKWPAC
jgi:hypothetical protein